MRRDSGESPVERPPVLGYGRGSRQRETPRQLSGRHKAESGKSYMQARLAVRIRVPR
jgi:hypothetical protein